MKTPTSDSSVKSAKSVEKKEEKKRGRKKINPEDKSSHSDSSAPETSVLPQTVNVGDKLKVYYGPTHEYKVTYEAKVLEIEKDATGPIYLVHYTGWNTRYDEWIQPQRIAENLSAYTKAKRLKQGSSGIASTSKTTTAKPASKRGRGISITGRSTAPESTPRSTTPSSVTSSSSRTKSPAVPMKSGRVSTRGRTRRISAQTDISVHSESDSDASESETEPEPELTRTRSGGAKSEEALKMKKGVLVSI